MAIQFLEQKSSLSPDGRLSANYLKCKINDVEVEFPYMNATKQDFDRSTDENPLSSQYFQFFVNELDPRLPSIADQCRQNQISTNYLNVIDNHQPILTDITLFYNSREVGETRRRAFLNLQQRLKTTFLSDIEIDKNQSIPDFTKQLEDLVSIETEQIKSPTISMSSPLDLFEEKLKIILESNDFDRLNIEWGSQSKYFDRWLILSKLISKKKIICNVVSIHKVRNYNDPFESYITKQFMIGAHSCSTGYPGGGFSNNSKPQKSFVLNENTWQYNENQEIDVKLAKTLSHNTLSKITMNSRKHILDDTYFTDFVPQDILNGFS